MTKARNIADLLDANGDVKSASLDNVPAVDLTNLSASNLTSGTIPDARITALSATKLTGSIADARIPASAVSQHATSFDDNAIVNDLSTIALRQATNENAIAYNTNSSFVDVFQDGSGIASHTTSTRNASEYVSTATTTNSDTSTSIYSGNYYNFFSASTVHQNHHDDDFNHYTTGREEQGGNYYDIFTATDWNNEATGGARKRYQTNWFDLGANVTCSTTSGAITLSGGQGDNNFVRFMGYNTLPTAVGTPSPNTVYSSVSPMTNGYNLSYTGLTNQTFVRYFALQSRFNVGANNYCSLKNLVITGTFRTATPSFGATGNFISNVITSSSSTSKMGAIITYEDTSGTNALNTDIILQLSADNGSTYSTATLTALPNFATGIKMAKVNDLSVTAGTQLKYKISFANQSSGSKEARIRGVSLQY